MGFFSKSFLQKRMFECTSWWEECIQNPNKLPNGVSKEGSLLSNVVLFCSCVTNLFQVPQPRTVPAHHWLSIVQPWLGMVGLTSLLRVSGLWLRAGRAHPSWRLWKGVTFLWAPLRLPTSLPQALLSSASRDPLSFFKTSAFLLCKGSIWLDQTRSEISLLSAVQWPEELWALAGSGGWHGKRQGIPLTAATDRA